jgi:hypothetical protein
MMFAGVASGDDRPWAATDMTMVAWREVPVQLVRISDLTTTKSGVEFGHLIADRIPIGADPYPHVVVWAGKQYLTDGHHRAVRWAMHGLTEFLARVLVIEEEAQAA